MIIYHNGNLSLWTKSISNELELTSKCPTPALKEAYQFTKSLSHCAVWLSMIMQSIKDQNCYTQHHHTDILNIIQHLKQLKRLSLEKSSISKIYERLIEPKDQSNVGIVGSIGITPIDLLLHYCAQIRIKSSRVDEIETLLATFIKSTKELNIRCASYATEVQLKGMHLITHDWAKDYPITVKNSRVLIVTSSGPREQLIEKQYFEDLLAKHNLKNDQDGVRYIHCIEMLPQQIATVTDDELIDFLLKHELNSSIGKNMLNNPLGMDKDILAEHAPEVLKKTCPFKH